MHCLLIPFKLLSPKSTLRSLLTTLIVTSLAVFGVSGLSFTFVFDDSTDVIDINFPPNQTSGVVYYSFIKNPRVPVVPPPSGGSENGCSNDILHDSYFSNLSVPYLSLTTAFASRARHPCRYIAPAPYFQAATEGWNHSFSFKNTRVTSITDPTQVLQCGMSCIVTSAQSDGSIVTAERELGGTVGLIEEVTLNTTYVFNVSTETYMNRSSLVLDHFTRVSCDVGNNNSNAGGFNDAVCTGYIQYNSSFWENGTLFALPQNFTAPVITNDVVLSGYPSTLTFYVPGLTTCPRYLVERANPGWGRNTPRTEPDSPYDSFVTLLLEEPTQFFNVSTVDIALINVTCIPPLSSGLSGDVVFVGRLGNSATDYYVSRIYTPGLRPTGDFVQPANITILKITPFFWGPAVTPVIAAGVKIRQLPVMQANLSSWSPSANYSSPPNSQNPSRCYNTTPRAADGTSTTLGVPQILCSVIGKAYIASFITSSTTFCCSAVGANIASPSAPFVWANFIHVEVVLSNDHIVSWFVDREGIMPVPMMTPAPTAAAAADDDSSGAPRNATSSPSSGSHHGEDDNTTGASGEGSTSSAIPAILAGTLAGVVIMCVF